MPEFCEYMGPMGGVCMEYQASQRAESELFNYCETHLALVQRERASRRRAAATLSVAPRRDGGRQVQGQRSRSEPYLGRSTVQWPFDRKGRLSIMDDELRERYIKKSYPRMASAPARLTTPSSPCEVIQEALEALTTSPRSQPVDVRRKVSRTRKLSPPRFEMISEPSSSLPHVWYMHTGDDNGIDSDPEYYAYTPYTTKVDVEVEALVPVVGEQEVAGNFFC